MKALGANILMLICIILINVMIWHFTLGYFAALPSVLVAIVGISAAVVFYMIFFSRRDCGHGRISDGGKHAWWPHVSGQCPECGEKF